MKTALVLEGGASRVYFSVGVMDVMLENGIAFDMITGASAGIANGVSYASKQIGRAYRIGVNHSCLPEYMGAKHLLNPKNKSFYNLKYVFDDIPNIHEPFDYKTFEEFNGDVVAVVTNIKTGKAEYLKVDGNDKKWTSITASCALPILFKPIEMDGNYYMDGGIVDPIPTEFALKSGCDKAIVLLTREKSYVKEPENALKIAMSMYKKYPEFYNALKIRTEVYNMSREKTLDLERKGKVLVLCPENTEGWKRTESSPEKIEEFYQHGREVAFKNLERIKEFMK